ncbi:hypothetical protein CEXT_320731 [Caerostris extrusa]|uniref:Ycf15 n=1 Tax=Caerostris extrusa TaxID=172846 RepID=A0AAV4P509_CAEEX|nr:hypothetical protein CEXT_320731 [Caerostris extrusa]
MFDTSKSDCNLVNFVAKRKSYLQLFRLQSPKYHGKWPIFIHQEVFKTSYLPLETWYAVLHNNLMMTLISCFTKESEGDSS